MTTTATTTTVLRLLASTHARLHQPEHEIEHRENEDELERPGRIIEERV